MSNNEDTTTTRRNYLRTAGALGVTAGLAGCGGNGSSSDDSSDTVDTGDDGSDTSEPDFSISLDIPEEFEEGEEVENIIEVENNGNAAGEYTGEYSLENGENISGTLNTELLEPGETQTFHLNDLLEETPGQGEYTLNINGEQTEFNILPEMFTWEDILESEEKRHRKIAEDNHAGVENISLADQSIRDADSSDYDEILDAILQTNMDVTQGLGERGINSDATSANMSEAIGVVNTLLIENNIDARQMNGPTAGHGYGLVIFRDHPFSLADSNWPVAGPVEDRVLQERPNSDAFDQVGSTVIDTDYDDLDSRSDRGAARTILSRSISLEGGPRNWNDIAYIDFAPEVVDDYLNLYFEGEGDKVFDKMRPAIGTLKELANREIIEAYGVVLESNPDELPYLSDYDSFNKYAQDIMDNHVKTYDDKEEFRDRVW